MSKELAKALRAFADKVESGQQLPNASAVCLVVADDKGNCNATYIGRQAPAHVAGIVLLTQGIQRFTLGMPGMSAPMSTSRGSTH